MATGDIIRLGGAIKSVQRGETKTSITETISPVNMEKAVVVVTDTSAMTGNNGNSDSSAMGYVSLTSSTTLKIVVPSHYSIGSTYYSELHWQVVEFI